MRFSPKYWLNLLVVAALGSQAQQVSVYPIGKAQFDSREIVQLSLSNGGDHFVAVNDKGLLSIRDIFDLSQLAKKETGQKPVFLDYLRNNQQVLLVSNKGEATIFDLELNELKKIDLKMEVNLAVLDPERTSLTFINGDDEIVVFNLKAGLAQHTIKLGSRLKAPIYLGYDQFGNELFVVDNLGTALICDPVKQQVISEFKLKSEEYEGSSSVLHSAGSNPGANYFVTGIQEVFIPKGGLAANTQPQRSNVLVGFDGLSKSEIKRIRVNDRLDRLIIGPELHNVTGYSEKKFDITVYDFLAGTEVARVTLPEYAATIDISDDGQFLGVGTDDGQLLMYEFVRNATPEIEIRSPALNRNIGESVVSDKEVRLAGTVSNTRVKELYANGEPLKVSSSNAFETTVSLYPGKNRISILGKDFDNNELAKEIYVTYAPSENSGQISEESFKSQKRVALVIGNADYQANAKLNNTINDAEKMAEALGQLGFEVTKIINGTYEEMKNATLQFGNDIRDVDVSVYYYAGHGLEVEGVNYLVPVDARISNALDIKQQALPLTSVIKTGHYANRQGLNMIILDACRNNPFPTGRRGGAGLAKENAPGGTIIAYATAPGSVASDGTGENGLYTSQLVDQLLTPQRIEDVFINTRNNVEQLSNGSQQPWEEARLNGIFYLSYE